MKLDDRGMRVFFQVTVGQLLSLLGSSLTGFALSVWIFQTTRSASLFGLGALASALPGLMMSPFAGVLVDRYERRLVMIASDVAGALLCLATAALFGAGRMQLGYVYAVIAFQSMLGVMYGPAWRASVSTLVPAEQLGRANGLIQMTTALVQMVAPGLSGLLLAVFEIQGVLLVDAATFVLSILILAAVRFPRSDFRTLPGRPPLREALEGWKFIRVRMGLMALLIFGALLDFTGAIANVTVAPMVLSQGSAAELGAVVSAGGFGAFAASLLLGIWGGPRRIVSGALGAALLAGICLILFGVAPGGAFRSAVSFGFLFGLSLVTSSSHVLWQRKVPPELQGRVFSLRAAFTLSSTPFAFVLAGPLVDHVLEPWITGGGTLADRLGAILGSGAGGGAALLFVGLGTWTLIGTVLAWFTPSVRRLEADLPDMVPPMNAPRVAGGGTPN